MFRQARLDAGLAATLLAASGRTLARPFKLTLCLTLRCNHRCSMCAIWSRDKGEELTTAQLDTLLASAPWLRWLDLTGGEIVLRRDLDAIAESIARHLPRLAMLHFPTNGLLPEALERAARTLVGRGDGPRLQVTVSVDGPPALHDELRGMPGAFDAAMETLRRLGALPGVRAFVGMTLQPRNLDAVDATVAAVARHLRGFDHAALHVNFLHRSPHYFANTGVPTCDAAQLRRVLADFQRRKGAPRDPVAAVEWLYLALVPRHLRDGRSPVPCRSAEVSAYVAPDGVVYPCIIDERPLGHLRDHGYDLGALWDSAQRQRLRAEVAADRCPGCWTGCEAYQTLLTQPLTTVRRALTPQPRASAEPLKP